MVSTGLRGSCGCVSVGAGSEAYANWIVAGTGASKGADGHGVQVLGWRGQVGIMTEYTLPTTSVLIPSYRRPNRLVACLTALAQQTILPGEVIGVWQGDDYQTRDVMVRMAEELPYRLVVLHSPDPGIVPAENLALENATGDVIYLTDDDVIPSPGWLERFLRFYADPSIGAVGGPADNYHPDGSLFERRDVEPIGRLTWFGRLYGNMHTQAVEWRDRPPSVVDHLVGYNMTLRRSAFDRFEPGLRRYWQMFELDACLQVRGGNTGSCSTTETWLTTSPPTPRSAAAVTATCK